MRRPGDHSATGASRALRPLDFCPQALLPCAKLRSELLAEILRLVDRSDLDLRFLTGHRIRATLHPFDRFLDRLHLPNPEASNELLGFGKRPVEDRLLPAGKAHALASTARMQAVAR